MRYKEENIVLRKENEDLKIRIKKLLKVNIELKEQLDLREEFKVESNFIKTRKG